MKKIKISQDMIFPILDVLLNGLNFFMHIFLSWYISLNDYSILNAALSFLAILFIFGISVQTFTTKEIGKNIRSYVFPQNMLLQILIVGLSVNLIIFIGHTVIMDVLRTTSTVLILIVLIFDFNLFLSYLRGIMQGHKMFLNLNMSFYIEVVTKMILIVVVLPRNIDIAIPLCGILAGMVVSIGHAVYILKLNNIFKMSSKAFNFKKIKALMHTVGSNFFLYYLTSITLIEANYLIGERTGIYAVSLKFSQLVLAVGLSLITVLNAYGSELILDRIAYIKYFEKWIKRFALGGLIILLGYQFVVRYFISFLFGEAFIPAKDYIVLQGFAYVMLTMSYLLISALLLLDQHFHLYHLIAISIVLTLGVYFFHQSVWDIILVEVVSFTLLFIGLTIDILKRGVIHVNRS